MAEPQAPALESILADFERAKSELLAVSDKLKSVDAIAEQRDAERRALTTSTAAFGETLKGLQELTVAIQEAVTGVADVMRTAGAALEATDASQLVDRLDALKVHQESAEKWRTTVLSEIRTGFDEQRQTIERASGAMDSQVTPLSEQINQLASDKTERQRLMQENADLKEKLDRVRSGLKPRQAEAMGL